MREFNHYNAAPELSPSNKEVAARQLATIQTEDLLSQWTYPEDDVERQCVDRMAQTPDDGGHVLCWRRKKRCNNRDCVDPETGTPYRFKGTERDLWNCPICGRDRHCRLKIPLPNRGCKHHGGSTPYGWGLPQTKTGSRSKYIQNASLRADFEKMLASPHLLDITEHIAFIRTHLNEIMGEYGGGVSRQLLNQMKKNRREYKKEARRQKPDLTIIRQLNIELDNLIAQGSRPDQVMADYRETLRDLTHAIASRDQHVTIERSMITFDKVWSILTNIEETLNIGLGMMLEVDDLRVDQLLEAMDIQFTWSLTTEERFKMREGLRADQEARKGKILSYASRRFKELAGSGLF